MGTTVKVFRSLREQNVDGKVRHYGDFIPEAGSWPNLATYMRNGYVEETYLDSDQYEELLAEQRAGDDVVVDDDGQTEISEPVEGNETPELSESDVVITETDIPSDEQPADEVSLAEEEAGEDVGEQRRTLPAGEPVIHDPDPKKRVRIRKGK